MRALGADITIVPSEGGKTTKKLILDMIETARRMSQEPETYWTDSSRTRTASPATSDWVRRSGVRRRGR
jgi:hypothetical protein